MWYKSRPQPWDNAALKASFATIELQTQPQKDTYNTEFVYDVYNNTEKNYKLEPNRLTVMAVLSEGNVLSKDFGHYQGSDVVLEGPEFIPPQGKARIKLRISYQYPSTFTNGDKDNIEKVSQSFNNRLKELSGFVVFDQGNHYRIDMPENWKQWDALKSK